MIRIGLAGIVLMTGLGFGQDFYLQSAFQASDPPVWFYPSLSQKKLRAEGLSLFFDGAEVLVLNLNTPAGLQDIRNVSIALKSAEAVTGNRIVGFFSFPRMPGFFWASELNSQPSNWRAFALKSNGSLWPRAPLPDSDIGSLIAFTGEHLDITNRAAVEQLLRNIRVTFNSEGPANQSIGPIFGYMVLNENKLTRTYSSVWSDLPQERDVDSPDRVIRLGHKTQFQLVVDDDPYYSFLNAPKRAIPLFSQGAAASFAAYASAHGYSYSQLPADRLEFNDDDGSLVALPSWVTFVPLSNTTYWSVWTEWVYETWTHFQEEVVREVCLAQQNNPDFKGVMYFQLPSWYSLRQASQGPVTFSYLDENEVLQTRTESLVNYAEYDRLNPVSSGTDMDYLLEGPWFSGIVHETTKSIHVSGGGLPPDQAEAVVDNHHRYRYYFMAQGALARQVCRQNGKIFGAFARAQYFTTHDVLTPSLFERGWERTLDPLQSEWTATIGPFFIKTEDLPSQYQGVLRGQQGTLRDIFAKLKNGYRAGFALTAKEQPLDRFLTSGSTAVFETRGASGNGTVSYLWQTSANGVNGWSNLSNGSHFSGANTGKLTILDLTENDEKWYRCRMRDATGPSGQVFSRSAKLIVFSNQSQQADSFYFAEGSLQGRTTERGGAIWTATATATLDGQAVSPSGTSAIATLPIVLPTNGDVLKLEAQLNPQAAGWCGLGFSGNNTGPFWTYGKVWIFLRANGNFTVHDDGTTAPALQSGPAPGFNASGFNHVALEYDHANHLARASINGQVVMDWRSVSYAGTITNAGFHIHNGTFHTTYLDDFELQQYAGNTCSAPVLTSQPQSQTVPVGGTAIFTVTAVGTPNLSYQWRKNGINISGQTGTQLTLSPVQTTDAGAYTCRVSNPCGAVVSQSASLTVTSGQTPWGGTARTIPGLIQAEDYDEGGAEIAYHDTSAGNTGGQYRTDDVDIAGLGGGNYAIGWTDSNEWLEYTVNIPASGTFICSVTAATPVNGKRIHLELNGSQRGPSIEIPNTNGWGLFETVHIPNIPLTSGNNQVLRLVFENGGLNLDKLVFSTNQTVSIVAEDRFNGTTAGGPVNNRTSEVGGLTWNAGAETIFGTNYFVTGTTGNHPNLTLPFNPANYSNRPCTVQADLNPNGAGWLAVGFANHAGWGWWADGQVWCFVNNSGKYTVLANGTAISLANNQNIPNFVANTAQHVKLAYEPLTNRTSVWINGTQVLNRVLIPGFTPAIQRAGMSGLNATLESSRFDNFQLWTEP